MNKELVKLWRQCEAETIIQRTYPDPQYTDKTVLVKLQFADFINWLELTPSQQSNPKLNE